MVSIGELYWGEARDRLNVLSNQAGSRDLWRAAEDQVAVARNALFPRACIGAGLGGRCLKLRP